MDDSSILHSTFAYLEEVLEAGGVDWRADIEGRAESLYAQCEEMALLAGLSIDDAMATAIERSAGPHTGLPRLGVSTSIACPMGRFERRDCRV